MSNIRVRQIKEDEVTWLSACYEKMGFKKSEFLNEFIVVAEFNNQECGLGCLVKLDKENWELGGIFVDDQYRGMGIARAIVSSPKEVFDKHVWCNINAGYTKKVLLLSKHMS